MDQLGEWMRFALGEEHFERVHAALGNLDVELRDHVSSQVFGEGWAKRGLLLREKALVAVSLLIANSRSELLDTHIRILGRLDVMIERTYAAINEVSRLAMRPLPPGLEETLYSLRFSGRVVNMSFTRDHLEGSFRDFLNSRDLALMELVIATSEQPQSHYSRDLRSDVVRAKAMGLDDNDIRDVAFLAIHYIGLPSAMALIDALKRQALADTATSDLEKISG